MEIPSNRSDLGLVAGDRVVVNRLSYGFRWPADSDFWGYFRVGECCPKVGDIIAYDYPDKSGRIGIDRVQGLPGDTLWMDHERTTFIVVPQRSLGLGTFVLSQKQVLGRPFCISYSVDASQPFFQLLRPNRLFVEIR